MSPSLSGRNAVVWVLLVAASISMTACGAGTAGEDTAAGDRTSAEGTTEETATVSVARCLRGEPSKALIEDARQRAEDLNIPFEKAIREVRLGNCFFSDVMDLEDELKNEEAETFAGYWADNESEYGYVFLFTRDGEETIRPYIRGEPYARFIEARSWADASLKEIAAARKEARRLFDSRLKNSPASGTSVKKNRVEIYVKDKARFEAAMREADIRLPDHVAVIESGACCVRLD